MSRVKYVFLPLLLALGFAHAGFADCDFPKRPVIPDGKTVSKEHLLEVIKVFKTRFQPEVREFQNCIKNERIAVGELATEDQIAEWTSRHDAAYEIEARLAEALNQAIRDYKAREAAGDTTSKGDAGQKTESDEKTSE